MAEPIDRRGHLTDPAQHHRRAHPRPAARALSRADVELDFIPTEDQEALRGAVREVLRAGLPARAPAGRAATRRRPYDRLVPAVERADRARRLHRPAARERRRARRRAGRRRAGLRGAGPRAGPRPTGRHPARRRPAAGRRARRARSAWSRPDSTRCSSSTSVTSPRWSCWTATTARWSMPAGRASATSDRAPARPADTGWAVSLAAGRHCARRHGVRRPARHRLAPGRRRAHRRPPGRHRGGDHRPRRRVRQAARAVRPADRLVPGGQAHVRRHVRARRDRLGRREARRRRRSTIPTSATPSGPRQVAKLLADEAASANSRACIQVHGGMGFTWEVVAHYYLKRAWVHATQFGSEERDGGVARAIPLRRFGR